MMSDYSSDDDSIENQNDSFEKSHNTQLITIPQDRIVSHTRENGVTRSRRKERERRSSVGRKPFALSNTTKLIIAIVLCVLVPIIYKSSAQLPSQSEMQHHLAAWMPGRQADEITIQRDPKTRQWGIRYSENLILSGVEMGTPARNVGVQTFLSRRITHVNGVSVLTAEHFRSIESRISDSITLQFAPSAFVVESTVTVSQRVVFQSGSFIEKGTQGVVVRVPGKLDGSVATIKSADVGLWDALPGQIEPAETQVKMLPGMTVRTVRTVVFQSGKRLPAGSVGVVSKVPGEFVGSQAEVTIGGLKWDAMPGQVQVVDSQSSTKATPPPTLATEEVVQLLDSLGHQQYLQKLVSYGLDRLDFLALASKRDGIMLGIKPVHWRRIVYEARHRVPISGRGRSGLEQLCSDLGEKQLLPKLISYGLDRLDQVAKTEARDGQALKIKPDQWTRIVNEARKRVNMTTNSLEQPQTATHQVLFRLLQDVGLQKHYKRLIVFGLDSLERVATSQNISTTIELQGWEWDRIHDEAKRRYSGKPGTHYSSANPKEEMEQDMVEHERLARKYDEEDTNRANLMEVGDIAASPPKQERTQESSSIIRHVVDGAAKKEQEELEKLSNVFKQLSELGAKERSSLLDGVKERSR